MKKSYFDVGRWLTPVEWEELRVWRTDPKNIDFRWVMGDPHPTMENYVFYTYSPNVKNGEYWVDANSPGAKKIKPRYYGPVENDKGKKILFNVHRILTDEEWDQLNKWRKENPTRVWNKGDKHPLQDALFWQYSREGRNGEAWVRPDLFHKRNKDYREKVLENIDHVRKINRESRNKRRAADPLLRVLKSTASVVRIFMKTNFGKPKKGRTVEILGIDRAGLRDHIESLFEPWMKWENYGSVNGKPPAGVQECWDVDHIIPLCTAQSESEAYGLFHYKNLRPLCSYENRYIKRGRLEY